MNLPDDVFRQIESDRSVRESEIRLVGNIARRTPNETERQMLFRTAVLLTYAHLEGFCKFALSAYLAAINSLNLSAKDASLPIVAASMSEIFAALRHPQTKHEFFVRSLPDDAKLHLFAREREFIERLQAAMERPVQLPDDLIDTESNLKPIVLMKNLFKLGLDYKLVDPHSASVNKLIGVRNAIAHGATLKVPDEEEVDGYVTTTFSVMSFVQREIYTALKQGTFRNQEHLTDPL
jgi:RiboL-PSP-HEPN